MTVSDTQLHALDPVLDEHYQRAQGRAEGGLLDRVVGAVVGIVQPQPDPADLDTLAGDLFAVVDALSSSVALRRAVTDPGAAARAAAAPGPRRCSTARCRAPPSTSWSRRRGCAGRAARRSSPRSSARRSAPSCSAAERAGMLDETEDELFRFARLVESDPELRNAFSDRAMPLSARQDLVSDLLTGRAGEATVALARRAVVARERTFAHTIEGYVDLAAAQKNRVVATVRVARPLDAEQRRRLQAALARQVGRDLVVQEVIDPDVLGGVRVELGDEVVEGTVAGRLDEARRLFGTG